MIKSLLVSLLLFAQIPFPGPGRAPVGSGPPASWSDDFNRSDGGLGGNWYNPGGFLSIASDQVVNVIGGIRGAYWSANSFAADQYSEITFSNAPGWCTGPIARANSSDDWYHAVVCGTDIYVQRIISRATSGTIGALSGSFTTGDVLRLECSGVGATVTLKVFKNGVQIGSDLTDTDGLRLLSGAAGVMTQVTDGNLTAWAGGDL